MTASALNDIFPQKRCTDKKPSSPNLRSPQGILHALKSVQLSWEVYHEVKRQEMPPLQPDFWPLTNSVSGSPELQDSQVLLLALNVWSGK